MLAYKLIFSLLFMVFLPPVAALDSKDILPPEQAFQLSASALSADKLELKWQISKGYHLYRDKFKFQSQTEAIQLGQINLPEGKAEHDEVFGEVFVYRGDLKVEIPIANPTHQEAIKLLVKYQGCADIGVCYPPQKVVLELSLPTETAGQSISTFNQFTKGLKNFAPDLFAKQLLPPEQAFKFFAEVKDDHTLHVSWLPAEGYFLYKQKLALSLDPTSPDTLGPLMLPTGESHQDPEFGQVEIYHQDVSLDVPITRNNQGPENLVLTAKYQGCADRGVCYPPMQSSVNLSLPAFTAVNGLQTTKAVTDLSEQDRIVNTLKQDGLALILFSFFGFGLLLAFTPCIFPMIPILSGIIVGQGEGINTRKGFLLSLCYVLASALMYTLFGVLAALFGGNLQATFQEPWIIAAFGGIFVLLSLSMFGFYNLELPSSLQTALSNSSGKHGNGSYLGAAIMGALSSLIVGPCVAAPLAAALIYIGQTGDVILGASALFAMGMGMGMPLLLMGASAGKLLPKAGGWLNNTKAVFGVILLAVAVWMLSRILPPQVTLFLYALLLIIPSVYLGAVDPLPCPASGWRKLWKGLGIVMLIYGVLQLIGLSAGADNPLLPLQGLASTSQAQPKAKLDFQKVRSVAELDALLKQAAADGQPLMLDFYADWCVSCKEMEAYTFSNADVQKRLSGFVLLQADVTENNAEDKALLKRFNLVGPPGIIFFSADGREQAASRVIGYQDAGQFLKTLQML